MNNQKWSRLFASKRYGNKTGRITLSVAEQQELLDDWSSKKISGTEWTILFTAVRYFMGGQNISSATFPSELIQGYYHRLSKNQKEAIVNELKRYYTTFGKFGDPNIDTIHWMKLWRCLDNTSHQEVKLIDGKECVVFEVNDRKYPLAEYLANPLMEVYLPRESICDQ